MKVNVLPSIAILFSSVILAFSPARADSLILCSGSISGTVPCSGGVTVPDYTNSGIGCAPTSIAMVLGYWDLRYNNTKLFVTQGGTASSGTDVQGTGLYLTSNVTNEISTIATDCLTDANGDTSSSKISPGINTFVSSKGYTLQASLIYSSTMSFMWVTLVNNIKAGRPMLFTVDSDGNGSPDHAIPVFGYDDRGTGGLWYACYLTNSESETPVWEKFQTIGNQWGVYQEIQIIPEPTTLIFLLTSIPLFFYILRRRHFIFNNSR